jgi:branched-chain amino acid transport system ATP-binding protein
MLKANDLHVYYGNSQALNGVSIDIQEGELVTVIGNNGAGKTTLLMTLSGILRPRAGVVEFHGVKINELPPYDIIRLGVAQVPQGRMLFPDMTVLENLELGIIRTKDKINIGSRLDRVYSYFEILAKREKQKAGTLSGGEQQMLTIARALMSGPKLLLLDEPSSGLAPLIVKHLTEVITDLNNEGLSILLVEQNAQMALELADRAYILESGHVFASGKALDLLKSELVKKAYLGLS